MIVLLATLLFLALSSFANAATFEAMNHSENLSGASIGRAYTVSSAQAVASTATVFSDELSMQAVSTFGYEAVCTGTTPDVKLEWQSTNTTNDTNFVTNATIDATVGATREVGNFAPQPSLFGRVKLTGQGTNGANVTCTVLIFLQGAP